MDSNRTDQGNKHEVTLQWGKAQPSVAAYVRSVVHNTHDAEDVIQATVAHIVDHFNEYDPSRPFVAWAIGIAKYRILHYRDQNRRRPLLLDDLALEALSDAITAESEQIDERLEALDHCIGRLSDKHQRLLIKRYHENQPRKEIAETMGIRQNSVSVLLRRIRSVLEDCVSKRMGDMSA